MDVYLFVLVGVISVVATYANTLIAPSSTSTVPAEIDIHSEVGQRLLSSARRLDYYYGDDDNDGDDQSYYYEEDDYYWLADFSLKFQGCQAIKQWNEDAEDYNDVRIKTKNLARFRLCPSNKCSRRNGYGCTKGYGDYVVGVDTYVQAYTEVQKRQDEYLCQQYLYKHCDCEESDDKGDDFNKEYCEYDCYMNGRRSYCVDRNPYADGDDDNPAWYDERDIQRYFEGCSQFNPPEFDDDDDANKDDDESYYIGSYCADQGGKVFLGLFTDETCTTFADKNAGRTTFKTLTRGQELPYSAKSMIRSDCVACLEQDQNKQNDQNDDDEINISDSCLSVYQASGKCETNIINGPSKINNAGCYYIEGIKIVRKDGIIDTRITRPNKVVSFFIFLFAVSFVLLGAYIYYLRMKLGMKINLDSM